MEVVEGVVALGMAEGITVVGETLRMEMVRTVVVEADTTTTAVHPEEELIMAEGQGGRPMGAGRRGRRTRTLLGVIMDGVDRTRISNMGRTAEIQSPRTTDTGHLHKTAMVAAAAAAAVRLGEEDTAHMAQMAMGVRTVVAGEVDMGAEVLWEVREVATEAAAMAAVAVVVEDTADMEVAEVVPIAMAAMAVLAMALRDTEATGEVTPEAVMEAMDKALKATLVEVDEEAEMIQILPIEVGAEVTDATKFILVPLLRMLQ